MSVLLLLQLASCQGSGKVLLGTGDSGGPPGESGTGPDTGLAEPRSPPASWCASFEDGSLEGAGYAGDYQVLQDGAIVANVAEGADFSALRGEERLDFAGDRALLMRSSDDGDPESVSIATTRSFTVEEAAFWWWQLSEVDERGVELSLDLLDDDGAVLASAAVPVLTGGFVPGLEKGMDPIDGFPEITTGDGSPGHMQLQAVDLSSMVGQVLRLRFYQHTNSAGNGFFTVLDDLCHGPDDPALDYVPLAGGEAAPARAPWRAPPPWRRLSRPGP